MPRPPVWMMRQAGRYLPDFMRLREKHSFFERVQTPELATEITVMPVDQVGVDAAIIFSDILVVPQVMGFNVEMQEGKGPVITNNIRNPQDTLHFLNTDVASDLSYVYEALRLTKGHLNNRVPLIGFAGAPWTILCYVVEGQGSKTFSNAKAFCFQHPEKAHQLLSAITEVTIEYLSNQINAGADVIQLFDSWGGLLSPVDYQQFSFPYLQRILSALKDRTQLIVFPKGCWHNLGQWAEIGASGLGVDWSMAPSWAREQAGNQITIQGNFDPSRLFSPIEEIRKATWDMIDAFGTRRYVANLGHGILPNVPVENAKAFVDAVKEYEQTSIAES